MKLTVDTKQRMSIAFYFLLEFYKVLMGTFLVSFIPQQCGNEVCSIHENMLRTDTEYIIGNAYNILCFLVVSSLYIVELQRENWCISYLDIDEHKSNHNLDTEIEMYPSFKVKMKTLNKRYLQLLYACIFFILSNFAISIYAIHDHYILSASTTNVLGYFVLLSNKLYKAYYIGKKSVQKERAFSAYLTTSKTYNTIDADHKITQIEEIVEIE